MTNKPDWIIQMEQAATVALAEVLAELDIETCECGDVLKGPVCLNCLDEYEKEIKETEYQVKKRKAQK